MPRPRPCDAWPGSCGVRDDGPVTRILALALVALVVLAGCAQNSEPSQTEPTTAVPTAETPTFDVSGALTLYGYGAVNLSGGRCVGDGGYADIREGAPVVIRDAEGTQLGLGVLDAGDRIGRQYLCDFRFRIDGLPESDATPYSAEVARRGQVPFTRDDALNVRMTLG